MYSNHKRIFFIAVLISSLLSPFIFFSSSLKPWVGSGFFATALQEIIYPIEYSVHAIAEFTTNSWDTYISLHNAAKENIKLKHEISVLKTTINDFEEQTLEVSRLRKFLGFAKRYNKKLIAAEVIGSPTFSPFQSIRITVGKTDKIKVGMPVVTSDGVVGRIIRVGFNYSDVQLLTDLHFNLDILLQRTRIRGILSGNDGSDCTLKLNRRAEIKIGDTIITSGIVGGFPKGLPVGHVKKISYASDNISQTITIEPWINSMRLEEVFVLQKNDREINKIINTAGNNWIKKSLLGGK